MKRLVTKFKTFFSVLGKSLTKFDYYKDVLKAKFSFSLKYLFFLFYLLSLFGGITIAGTVAFGVIPKVPQFVSTFETKALSFYPEGLVVTIKNGQLTTNEKEPFYIDSLKELKLFPNFEHFITIDTSANLSDISKYNTVILVGKDAVATKDNSSSSYQLYPITKTTNLTISKSSYMQLLGSIKPYFNYIQPVLIAIILIALFVGPFIFAGISLVGELIYLLVFTLVFYIVTKLIKKDLTYKKLYQLAMHAATLPILVGFVISVFGIQTPFLLGSLILLVFMLLVVNQL